jgi:hypothetical protein
VAPEAHAKRSGDSFRRISALLRDRLNGILLFQRQTRGKRARYLRWYRNEQAHAQGSKS